MDVHRSGITLTLINCVRNEHAYARSLTRNDDDAEDLLQDAVLKLVLSSENLDAVSSVRGWLRRMIHNLYVDTLRRQERGPKCLPLDDDDDLPYLNGRLLFDEADLYEGLCLRDLQTRVRIAVKGLPPEYEEVVRLHYTYSMSVSEIAELLGLPPGTVCSRLARARAQLRKDLFEVVAECW